MLTYAREDTHYLLHIYDVLRNQLIQRSNEMKNLLRSVYTKSADLCGTVSLAKLVFAIEKYRKSSVFVDWIILLSTNKSWSCLTFLFFDLCSLTLS